MSFIQKNARVMFAIIGLAIATPAILSLTASIGSASGYMVASGRSGFVCFPGGGEECPEGSSFGSDM